MVGNHQETIPVTGNGFPSRPWLWKRGTIPPIWSCPFLTLDHCLRRLMPVQPFARNQGPHLWQKTSASDSYLHFVQLLLDCILSDPEPTPPPRPPHAPGQSHPFRFRSGVVSSAARAESGWRRLYKARPRCREVFRRRTRRRTTSCEALQGERREASRKTCGHGSKIPVSPQ